MSAGQSHTAIALRSMKCCGTFFDRGERWAIRLSLRSRAPDGNEAFAAQALPTLRACRWVGS